MKRACFLEGEQARYRFRLSAGLAAASFDRWTCEPDEARLRDPLRMADRHAWGKRMNG